MADARAKIAAWGRDTTASGRTAVSATARRMSLPYSQVFLTSFGGSPGPKGRRVAKGKYFALRTDAPRFYARRFSQFEKWHILLGHYYATLKDVSRFGSELESLKLQLLEMSSVVEQSLQRSIDAVVLGDRDAAEKVLEAEKHVNAIEVAIDARAIELLTLHQPMASNLRFIIAALKINSNLERMGDLSVLMAHHAISLIDCSAFELIVDIPLIAGLVQSMVRESIDAFVKEDQDLARKVLCSDDAVDELRSDCYYQLIPFMKKDPQNIAPALNLLAVTRGDGTDFRIMRPTLPKMSFFL